VYTPKNVIVIYSNVDIILYVLGNLKLLDAIKVSYVVSMVLMSA